MTGNSILKRRILARNLVQALMGSLGSQNIHPTLEREEKTSYMITESESEPRVFHTSVSLHAHFILMMSMPVTVRLT